MMRLARFLILVVLTLTAAPSWLVSPATGQASRGRLVVGSKNFTESCLLAELMAQLVEGHTEISVERKVNLGGTLICFTALREGEIDLYADYTGTGWSVVLKEEGKITDPLRAYLHVRERYRKEFGIRWLLPFGLNNTYAIAMEETKAAELGVHRISDLVPLASKLKAGFSIEFMNRDDGFPGLISTYELEFDDVRALEHGLAYTAIRSEEVDLIDAYSTDGKLKRYSLRVLEDDRSFFPPYNAAPLIREQTLETYPELEELLSRLAFRLSDEKMQALNFRVEEEGVSFEAAARGFLEQEKLLASNGTPSPEKIGRRARGFWSLMIARIPETLELGLEHLALTLAAVLLASSLAIPLGVTITKRPRLREISLGVAGVIQTIPSLALLAFMIPFLGIDLRAAVAALFLYAVLPILRNTYTGIKEVDPDLIDAAKGMGMRPSQVLWRVELPLASRTILAGVRTSTVITIGVATLAAFIGAGGYGEPIVTGLYLDDTNLILTGAVPATCLALLADFGLGQLERRLSPGIKAEP